jgi:hypothetical protein
MFEEAVSLLRANARSVLAISGLFAAPLAVIVALGLAADFSLVGFTTTDRAAVTEAARRLLAQLPLLVAGVVVFMLVVMVLSTLAYAGISYVVGRAARGDRPTARETLAALRRLLPSLVGLPVIQLLLIAGYVIAALIVTVALAAIAVTAAGAIGILLAFVAYVVSVAGLIFLAVRWSLAVVAVVHDRASAYGALVRSWDVVRGSTWRVAGIMLIVTLAASIPTGLAFPFLGQMMAGTGPVEPLALIGFAVVYGLALTIAGPIVSAVLTLVYFDLAAKPVEPG